VGEPYRYHWHWDLASPRDSLWPYVCNTERFNKAVGLPMPDFHDEPAEGGGSRRFGQTRQLGMLLKWVENPFEWVRPVTFGVLREYTSGPLISNKSTVVLEPLDTGGTRLHHSLELLPRNVLGRVAVPIEISRLRETFEKAYRRIDDKLSAGQKADGFDLGLDPFEDPVDHLSSASSLRFESLMAQAREFVLADREALDAVGAAIRMAPDHVVERMRPWQMARMWGLDGDRVLDAFLVAAHVGLVELNWSILCPNCRVPSDNRPSLRRLTPQAHCEACNINYDVEFVESVELTFKTSGQIRPIETHTYCVGSPANTLHVAVQQRLLPGESRTLEVELEPGVYRVLGQRFKPQVYVDVSETGMDKATFVVDEGNNGRLVPDSLRAGGATLTLTNRSKYDQTIRFDRAAWRDDAVTAAVVMTRMAFREFFSTEILSPGLHVDVGHLAILFTDLTGSTALYSEVGDATAFSMVRAHFDVLADVAHKWRGTIVKTIGDAIMAVWHDPLDAVQAGLAFHRALRDRPETAHLRLKIGLHHGRTIGVTLNGTADYFGTTVNTAARMEKASGSGQVALSPMIAEEPTVARFLAEHPELIAGTRDMEFKGLDGTFTCTVLQEKGHGD